MSYKPCLIVTGASRGLGQHICRRAIENGYSVVGLARHKTPDASFPMEICDVADAGMVGGVFRKFRDLPVYGLINAAGCASMNLHITTPVDSMRAIIECNLLGTLYCCAEGGRLLARRKNGRIINFSSIAVPYALAGEGAYVAAKAGIEGFSRSFAREMAPFGVTVNVVAPGPVPTALIKGVDPRKIAALRKRQVLPRSLDQDDVWDIVSLLLDEKSSVLSGEVLYLGGV